MRRVLKKIAKADVGVVAGGQLLQQALTMLTGILIARMLGAAAYGIVNLLRNIIQLLGVLAPLGLDLALLKHVGKTTGPDRRLEAVLLRLRLVTFAFNLLVLLVGVFASGWLMRHVYRFPNFDQLLILALVALPFSADLAVMGAYYRGRGRPASFALMTLYLQPVARVAMVLLAWLWFRNAFAVVAINTLQIGLSAVTMWVHSTRWRRADRRAEETEAASPAPERERPAWAEARLILGESVWMLGNLFVYALMRFADTLTLGVYAPARVVGEYAALTTVAQLIQIWPAAASQTLGPRVSRLYQAGDLAGVHKALSDYFRMAMMVAGFVFAGIAAFGERLHLVFGPSFEFRPELCLLLGLGYLVSAGFSPMGYALSMTGRHRAELAILSVGGVGLVALCQLLVPRYEAMGAATAVVIAFAAIDLTRYVYVSRMLKFAPGRLRDLATPVMALACAYLAKILLEKALGADLLPTILACMVYTVFYGLCLFTLLLSPAERRALKQRLSGSEQP